mmetsp:Transcript_9554/g.18345  ORF Transcript_9554/g.18345 Transcript_9554/m.18345 type:complete len:117 (+) Transcript_9554:6-356(+)
MQLTQKQACGRSRCAKHIYTEASKRIDPAPRSLTLCRLHNNGKSLNESFPLVFSKLGLLSLLKLKSQSFFARSSGDMFTCSGSFGLTAAVAGAEDTEDDCASETGVVLIPMPGTAG